jgi:hypothetical protein
VSCLIFRIKCLYISGNLNLNGKLNVYKYEQIIIVINFEWDVLIIIDPVKNELRSQMK